MAHSLSAKKRVRQNLKQRARNRARKGAIKDQTKLFLSAMTKGDVATAEKELNKVVSVMDKVAVKHTIHKKQASRRRSRLTKRLNALKAAPVAAAPTGKPAKSAAKKG